MIFSDTKKNRTFPGFLIHWFPWVVIGILALLVYLGINPFIHQFVILGGAVPEKHGVRVDVFDRPQPKGKPAYTFFNSSEKLTLEKSDSSLAAYGLWKVTQKGNYLLHLECDDYGELNIDGKNLIHLTGVNARNIGEAEIILEEGYHVLVLRLFNGPEKGWGTLQNIDPQKSFSLLAGDSVIYLERSNVETWLHAVSVGRQVSLILLSFCLIVLTLMGFIYSGRRPKEIHSRISRRSKRIFYAVIVFSCLIRLGLVIKGGQFYFPDENGLWIAYDFLKGFLKTNSFDFQKIFLGNFGQIGFKIAFLPFLLLHLGIVKLFTGQYAIVTMRYIPALLMIPFSVGIIVLIFKISLRSGADEKESLLAMILGASSITLTYYSRHCFPYDLSLFFILASIWMSLRQRFSFTNSFFCGTLISLGFLIYNGYWLSCVIATVLHIMYSNISLSSRFKKTIALTSGILSILLSLHLAYVFIFGISLFKIFLGFATTVNQGELSEGWLLPWLYLWDAEHGLLIIWILGSLLSFFIWVKTKGTSLRRIMIWFLIIGGIYLGLTFGSTFFKKFVVYGRLARQMVPFFCILSAAGLSGFLSKVSLKVKVLILFFFMIQVGWNYYQTLQISFPNEIRLILDRKYGQKNITYAWTMRSAFGANELPQIKNGRFILTNATHFYPIEGFLPQPKGEVILTFRHPLSFLPYQYEGYPPYQRERLRTHSFFIQFIDTKKKP